LARITVRQSLGRAVCDRQDGTMSHSASRDDATSRKVIDVAVGILVGLRGCTEREAFDELVEVVNRTGLGIFSVASSLTAVASGSSSASDSEAFNAWGELIRRARAASLATTY
jgi:hypothetical protein